MTPSSAIIQPRPRRRTSARLAACVLLAPALAAPAVAAAQAAATCRGQTATIEAADRDTVRGTPGADVIVAVDVVHVIAGGGNDVVCASATREGRGVIVDAGPGRDVVDTRATTSSSFPQVDLGPGDDTYVGSVADDDVEAGDRRSTGVDTIRTGGGSDRVTTGARGRPNPDRVSLGAGPDDLFLRGRPTGSFVDAGRPGTVFAGDSARLPWSIQLNRGVIRVGDATARLEGFGGAWVDTTPFTRLAVRGTAGDDDVTVVRPRAAGVAPVEIDLLAGDDDLTLEGPIGGRASLGRGENWITLDAPRSFRGPVREDLQGSLRQGVFRVGDARLRAKGIHVLSVRDFDRVRLTGDARGTTFFVDACRTDVEAGPGDDYLQASLPIPTSACPAGRRLGAELRGQAGDDEISGTQVGDVLIGGPGRDEIWDPYLRDRDVCAAERTDGC